MNLSLEGKFAIICGSTQGIGLAIAEELALLGANCTLIARNEEALKEAVSKLDIQLMQQHGYLLADRPSQGLVPIRLCLGRNLSLETQAFRAVGHAIQIRS